jgi:hypothetical protein
MTDERDEREKEQRAEHDAWMKQAKRDEALRRKVHRLERDYFTPAAIRDRQRQGTAVEILNGLLAGIGGTLEERLRLVDKADWNLLTAISYKLAEQMMQRDEQLRAANGAKEMVRMHGEIAVDLYREHAKEPAK